NASRCDAHVQDFAAWTTAVADGTVPNYAFIVPNVTDDGHNSNLSVADTWLRGWLAPLLNDSFASSSVFFIVYDESKNSDRGYDGLDGGRVYFAAAGPDVRANFTDPANASSYNLLSTTEWLLGLGSTSHNDSGSAFPPMVSLFPPVAPPTFSLSGTVTFRDNGSAVEGARVNLTPDGSTELTPANGSFRFQVPNGTYRLTANTSGFPDQTVPVTI
ncbi:acid phosphatase PHOa, partial [mine drainage metagenome]